MLWIIIAVGFLLVIGWFLVSPIEMDIDTRIPQASFKWQSIGNVILVYEKQEWFLKVKVFFFRKKWLLRKLFRASPKKKKQPETIKTKGTSNFKWLLRSLKILRTFRIIEWKIAVDGNDHIGYTMMYSLNFLPYLRNHIRINFEDQTYFLIRIRNHPWRVVYAWLK